jgi:hypothetical protein
MHRRTVAPIMTETVRYMLMRSCSVSLVPKTGKTGAEGSQRDSRAAIKPRVEMIVQYPSLVLSNKRAHAFDWCLSHHCTCQLAVEVT